MIRIKKLCLLVSIAICLLVSAQAAAADGKLAVAVSQSQVLTFSGVERVAVANPEIADVIVVSGYEILLVGKAPGLTTLHVWTAGGRASYTVEVGANDTLIAQEIKNILGYEDIRVSKVNKNVILEGTVNDQYQKARAEKVAAAYGDKVVNLLEITRPLQVKIEAIVLEIDREKSNRLGIKWGNSVASPGTFVLGQGVSNSVMGNRSFGNLGGYQNILGQLDALVKDKTAKILSQPNVITLSGEKANILVGGQIPVPISNQNGSIMIEWKDYGIKLDISPEVSGEGLINSKIKAEVSSLDWTSEHQIGIGYNLKIPPLTMRKAETSIALASGETMAIGGLISSETSKDVYKVPFLANLPVLGKLFTSTAFSRGETELIILVTPTIVDPQKYAPQSSQEMKDFGKENPWGGKPNGK